MNDAVSAAALRAELLEGLPRWREQIPDDDNARSTLWIGIAMRSVSLTGGLLRSVFVELMPEVPLKPRMTIGDYVHALEREGPRRRLTCLGQERRLMSKGDVDLLNRFTRLRAGIAHEEDGEHFTAADFGRIRPSNVRAVLDIVEQIFALPLVDELVCVEEAKKLSS